MARIAVVAVVLSLAFSPVAHAKPTSPLCDSATYRKAHPLICDTNRAAPGQFPSRGGGGGGLLGAIGGLLGGLTGGLL